MESMSAIQTRVAVEEVGSPQRRLPSTQTALDALADLVSAQAPIALDGVDARRRVDQLLRTQAEASWKTLRNRYQRIEIAAREFQVATARAIDLVDEMFPKGKGDEIAPLARLALVAAVTRRLVVDGPDHAENALRPYRSTL